MRMEEYEKQNKKIKKQTSDEKSIDNLHLVIILDESGSMSGIQNDIINSINTLMKGQQELKKDNTTVTLIKFNGAGILRIL